MVPAHVRLDHAGRAVAGLRRVIGVHTADRLGMQVRDALVRGGGVGVHLVHHVHRVVVRVADRLLLSVPRRHLLLVDRHGGLVLEALNILQQRLADALEVVGGLDRLVDLPRGGQKGFVFVGVGGDDELILRLPVMHVLREHSTHHLPEESAAHRLLAFMDVVDARFDRHGLVFAGAVGDLVGDALEVADDGSKALRRVVVKYGLLPLELRRVRFVDADLFARNGRKITLQNIVAVLLGVERRAHAQKGAEHVDALDERHARELAVGVEVFAAEQDHGGAVRRVILRLSHEGVVRVVAVILVRRLPGADLPALGREALDRTEPAAVVARHDRDPLRFAAADVDVRPAAEGFRLRVDQILRVAVFAFDDFAAAVPMEVGAARLAFQNDHKSTSVFGFAELSIARNGDGRKWLRKGFWTEWKDARDWGFPFRFDLFSPFFEGFSIGKIIFIF